MTSRDPDIYRTLLENLSDGVVVIDFDGSVRIANAAFCRMFGFDPDEAIGSSFGELFIAFEGFDGFTQIVIDAVAERGDIARRVTRVRVGEERRSLSVATSCLLAGEERVAVIVVVSDITEIRELRETELRQAAVIETQLGELQGAYRDLEARNEALSALTKRVRAARGAAMLFVMVLFLAIGAWYVRPLDLFSATAARDTGPAVEAGAPGALPTVTVQPRDFRSTIALGGNLAPGRLAEIVSPIESHVSAAHVAPGDRVAVGDPLVDLDTGQLAADYRRAQVDHIKARDRLVEIEDWENSTDMARARRAWRRAKIALDDAERHLGRTAFLLEQGLVPASQHEDAQRQRQNRTLDVEEARRELEAVKARGDDEAKRVVQLEARTAEERLRAQGRKLELARVRAPIAGVVMAAEGPGARPLTKGRRVGQGELMLSIADLERLSVVTRVDEVDVRKVTTGQRAWITGPGFPGLRVEGAVTRVSSQAGRRARRRGAPQFEVVVTLDRLEADAFDRLRVGMSAYVTIVVHHRPAALLVPIDAVEQGDGKAWVQVLAGTAAERRAVELGLTTLDSVEVVKGLSPGDRVVLVR
ncbi:MAG: PAS domain S-box protein [Gammaproteobacteria bacterium]|nr:PAS domain S-box protein [Gammaproteobacteria bacterium]